MDITSRDARTTRQGNDAWFTGEVKLEDLVEPSPPARTAAAYVTFQPGARTAWHTHPLGQTLVVTTGWGLAQCEGGPVRKIGPGDVVCFAPGEKHWHGATPDSAMTHLAIHERLDGKSVDWLEQVSDAEYGA